ncbi:MAG TPA: single-stranded DNA-binding protein [Elusimicrobiales bacterium]|nr:single-stranded DNA-binding protein [Elusimicrobiales bacterium]
MNIRIPEQNYVLLTGRLTRDPELRTTTKGTPVCSFDIAVNRRYKDNNSGEWRDDTTYVPITVWGPMGERCKEKLRKGSPVHVEGRLRGEEYTDKTGQKRKVMRVVANRVQFLAMADKPGESEQAGTPASPEETGSKEEGLDEVPF